MNYSTELLSRHPIISDQIKHPALEVILGQLERVILAGTPGHVVEFGCYVGTTSLFIRRLLDAYDVSGLREFHVYDSFEGLPPKQPQDSSAAGVDFQAGKLSASRRELVKQFRRANLRTPHIHKGWFNQLGIDDVPDEIAFAFLDGDFYSSIMDSLRLAYPRMSDGGIICIDDYQRETLPGVERAVRDFFRDRPDLQVRQIHNIGIIVK